jgi:hypothetical protein
MCFKCPHTNKMHRKIKPEPSDAKLTGTTFRCTARLDNGDDCDCEIAWFSYQDYLRAANDKRREEL